MARIVTLGNLVTRCLRAGNKEVGNPDPVSGGAADPSIEPYETKTWISNYYAELHAIVSEAGARYFETEATITANGATGYALPDGHFSTLGVDLRVDANDRRRPLDRIAAQERAFHQGRTGEAYYFAIEASNLVLYPRPTSGTYLHRYIPQPTDYSLAVDSTNVDVINVYGERLIIWGVASVLLHKGEADQVRAVAEHKAASDKLLEWAVSRVLEDGIPRFVREDAGGRGRSPASFRRTPT